jgi:phospholipid/cholesterol/gamma-HCH transport system substrate-binding protein
MEIRARYMIMGVFLLAVAGSVFGFVYWLNNSGGFRDRVAYRIRFESSVSGLLTGAAVLFNGIRVGEVTGLYLRADNPNEVDVTIKVHPQTPIRADTLVDLDFQGLTGVAAISLNGGTPDRMLPPSNGMPPVLMAKSSAGLSITQSARDALLKLNGILEDNSIPLKELVGNINSFSGALARNSDKVDGILSGLERMTGGTRGKDGDKAFDLNAPRAFENVPKPLRGQLVIPEPTAIIQLDAQTIVFRASKNESPLPGGPRWADNLSRLLQEKIVQSFENAGQQDKVSRNADAVTAEFQLLVDIRSFQLITKPAPTAEVELSAKLVDNAGHILDARVLQFTAAAKSEETADAVAAFDEALGKALKDLVTWASTALASPV